MHKQPDKEKCAAESAPSRASSALPPLVVFLAENRRDNSTPGDLACGSTNKAVAGTIASAIPAGQFPVDCAPVLNPPWRRPAETRESGRKRSSTTAGIRLPKGRGVDRKGSTTLPAPGADAGAKRAGNSAPPQDCAEQVGGMGSFGGRGGSGAAHREGAGAGARAPGPRAVRRPSHGPSVR